MRSIMKIKFFLGKKFFLSFFVLTLLIALSLTGWIRTVDAAAPGITNPSIIADIAEQSSPAVVWIITTYETEDSPRLFFGPPTKKEYQSQGSGFFFNDSGSILTNAHVVAGAKSIEVILKDQKEPMTASLVGIDTDLDVAVLKVNSQNKTPYLKLGDSDKSRIGDWVIAIGNPFGLDHTVTVGIISAKGRPLIAGDGNNDSQSYENMIQTDAAINPGNSGGPLLDLEGAIIGINTAVSANGQGLGFAIPINSVKNVLQELVTTGKVSRPWLGAQFIDLKMVNARFKSKLHLTDYNDGVLIGPVRNSPAARAGLQDFDLIVEFNHQTVSDSSELISAIAKQKPGDRVNVTFVRNGRKFNVDVVLDEKPQPK
ncbi:MAG TPA: peptidase S1 [Firmicutes bacterium]|jgi:serine protease Do|nr:peptidase S1 [Bacillota bacterium]